MFLIFIKIFGCIKSLFQYVGSFVVAGGAGGGGLVASRHVGDLNSSTRDRTRVPCIGRWILSHWTTRAAPYSPLSFIRLSHYTPQAEGTCLGPTIEQTTFTFIELIKMISQKPVCIKFCLFGWVLKIV